MKEYNKHSYLFYSPYIPPYPGAKAMDKEKAWKDKVVLLTGGTGSFGQQFTKILIDRFSPKKLIIFSRDELKQFEMQKAFNSPNMRYFIGDVRDVDRLRRAMDGVDIVVHAAALKQVPTCEYNPNEAILTNIMGSRNVIEAAIDSGVSKVIALSTDKAVNPVNLYGATKLCAEKLFVQSNVYSGSKSTRFSCVRYGNVVGSRGSVIPIFMEQRARGTVTVTDERMSRFWLTLEQGALFVINCLAEMQGGEVFVPKIASMKIMDLVRAIAPECKVDFTGLRPGEKIHEVLISESESRNTLELDNMFVIQPQHSWWRRDKWAQAKPVPADFSYSSENNDRWLTTEEILSLASPAPSQSRTDAKRQSALRAVK